MYFITPEDRRKWKETYEKIYNGNIPPDKIRPSLQPTHTPIFHFYVGAGLLSSGKNDLGTEWIEKGALLEEDGLFLNAFLMGFLQRHEGRLSMPAVVFSDPVPYIHFTTMPIMKQSRQNFIKHVCHSLPTYTKPARFMDIGCGDGSLTVSLLEKLNSEGVITDISEILLIDQSEGMCEKAVETVGNRFPDAKISIINSRIQDCAKNIEGRYDLAISSLAYHHMPWDDKIVHLKELSEKIDRFILFELDANNDLPELGTPELAVSVYQSYGRLIDFVFSHSATVKTAIDCVDLFLINEAVSLITEPRGKRNDYHMLQRQWHEVFRQGLGKEFTCVSEAPNYSDEYITLYTIQYARTES